MTIERSVKSFYSYGYYKEHIFPKLLPNQWKNYLERLELQPFSKLTTKEILALEFTSELKEALRNIDRSVYGNHRDAELYKSFQDIEDFTQHRFHMKIEDIKNGK